MTEISAIWSKILDFQLKSGSYAETMNMWKKRNSLADMLMQKFLQYDRNFFTFVGKITDFALFLGEMAEISVMSQKFLRQYIQN